MRYWVYGVDGSSKLPRDPLFLEADSEEAARAQATAEGMEVEEIEAVRPRTAAVLEPKPPDSAFVRFLRTEYVLARGLVIVLRILAVLAAVWAVVNTGNAVDAAGAAEARLKAAHLDRALAEARIAASLAVFAAVVYGVALVSILLALAEGLRLALAIECRTRDRPAAPDREKPRRRPQ